MRRICTYVAIFQQQGSAIKLFNIDLNLLLMLSLLLQTRSVSATARRIGTSQPTASRALARLRELFGDPLLIRTNSGMELTRRAEELVEPLRDWLAHTDALLVDRSFDPATVKRRFRIASTDFGVSAAIAPALARFHGEAPCAAIDILPFTEGMHGKLASGEIDLMVSGLDPDNSITYSQRLFQMTGACLMRADHPLALETTERISLDQFLEWPHISILVGEDGFDRVAALLGARAAERRVIATIPYFQAAHTLLDASDALMLLPMPTARRLLRDERIAVRQAPDILPSMDYWVFWHERSRRDPATMWLVDLLADGCAAARG